MIYRRRDVVTVRYPNVDLKTWKSRPALVVQSESIDTGLPQIILALISGQVEKRKGETRIMVRKDSKVGRNMGIRADSVIVTDVLQTVSYDKLRC